MGLRVGDPETWGFVRCGKVAANEISHCVIIGDKVLYENVNEMLEGSGCHAIAY